MTIVRHDTLREGTRLGLIVATAIWLWLAAVDALVGQPGRTFTVLGGIAGFTALHYLLNVAYGIAVMAAVHASEREPSLIIGLAFGGAIKQHLFHAVPVAAAFILGGAIILWVERSRRLARVEQVDDVTWKDALKVGLAQSFALIPGMSRAGATIIGGMLFGLSRRAATEFSFFLAVPTLIAAGAYDLYRNRALLDVGDLGVFSAGFVVSFVSAFLCVRWLLRYIATHDFSAFAWYRIAFGVIVLATGYAGIVDWSAD